MANNRPWVLAGRMDNFDDGSEFRRVHRAKKICQPVIEAKQIHALCRGPSYRLTGRFKSLR